MKFDRPLHKFREQMSNFGQIRAKTLTFTPDLGRIVSGEASFHGAAPEYLAWLKDESRPIAESLSPTGQELFRKQLDRVEEFLRQHQPHERSLVIVAGPGVWEIVSLQREIQNELHWGKPSVTQLLWLASEYKPYGIVAVDHVGARFFHYWLGEMVEYEEKKFAVDISQWKMEELGHVTGQGVRKTRGSQREVFRNRMEGQYARLCRETAQQAVIFCTKKDRFCTRIRRDPHFRLLSEER